MRIMRLVTVASLAFAGYRLYKRYAKPEGSVREISTKPVTPI